MIDQPGPCAICGRTVQTLDPLTDYARDITGELFHYPECWRVRYPLPVTDDTDDTDSQEGR